MRRQETENTSPAHPGLLAPSSESQRGRIWRHEDNWAGKTLNTGMRCDEAAKVELFGCKPHGANLQTVCLEKQGLSVNTDKQTASLR